MKRLIYSLLIALGHSSLFQAMEKHKAQPENKETIVSAAYKGDIDLFQSLFNEATDVNQRDKNGRTALHYVALHGSKEIFLKLITHSDLDVNAQDKDGVTPIQVAARKNILLAVYALLKMGADPDIKDSHGTSARDEAKQSGYEAMLFLFDLFKKKDN